MRAAQVTFAALGFSGLVMASAPARADWDDDYDHWRRHEWREQVRQEQEDRRQAWREQRWRERQWAPAYVPAPPIPYAPPPLYYAAPPRYYPPPPPVIYAPPPVYRGSGFSIGLEFR